MKERYTALIRALIAECEDLELLDLIYRILEKSRMKGA